MKYSAFVQYFSKTWYILNQTLQQIFRIRSSLLDSVSVAHYGPQHLLKSKYNLVWEVKLKKDNYKVNFLLNSPPAEVDTMFKLII